MAIEQLVGHFEAVEDPRCRGKVEHRLVDILAIAVCAVIACAESWDDIALYGRSKLAWLRTFLALPQVGEAHCRAQLPGPGLLATAPGATHEILLACPVLTRDDVPSRWRRNRACRSKTWRSIWVRSRTRAVPVRSGIACSISCDCGVCGGCLC